MNTENNQERCFIHNVRLDDHFTITSNLTPKDENLSWAAKGVLWYILSQSKNWKVHTWQLADIYDGDKRGNGLDAIKSIIKELRAHGYIDYKKYQDEEGKWCHRYDVYPMKVKDFQKIIPEVVEPPLVKPPLVKPPILTSNKVNKKLINKPPTPTPSNEVLVGGLSSKDKFSNKNENNKFPYLCLESVSIHINDKIRLTDEYSEDVVQKSLAFVNSEDFKLQGTLDQAIFYFCKHPEHIKETKDEIDNRKMRENEEESIKITMRRRISDNICYESMKYIRENEMNPDLSPRSLIEYIEFIINDKVQKIKYDQSNFREFIKKILKQLGLPVFEIVNELP